MEDESPVTNSVEVGKRVGFVGKTRSQHAMEYLKAKMRPDYEGNLGLNEAYRSGLEDMVNYIDGL